MVEVLASPWFYWSIAAVIGVWGVVLLVRGLWRDRSRSIPRCPRCWYDLSGAKAQSQADVNAAAALVLPVTCPECGKITRKQRRLHRTRRHWFTIILGLLIVSLAVYSYEVRHRLVRGDEKLKTALVPSTVYVAILPWCEKATHEVVEARFYNRVLPYKAEPNGRGLWRWQELIYQRSLSQIVATGGTNERDSAMHLLLSMASKDDDSALDYFISHLDHEDVNVRRKGMMWAHSLQKRMLRGRDAVIARLEDEDEMLRQQAGWVLGQIGAEQTNGLSDEELCRVAGLLLAADNGYGEGIARDIYLCEMVRRGGTPIEKWLNERVATAPKMRHGDGLMNLEILTALRRVEGRADPLTIEIAESPDIRGWANMPLPQLKVILRNDDPGKLEIGFQRHGDNRGERPMRWRFEVRDKDGKPMPIDLESHNFGGISSYGSLKHGESFDIIIPMDKYVPPLPAGEYRVVLQYHNSRQISQLGEVVDVIYAKSKEMKMVVEP